MFVKLFKSLAPGRATGGDVELNSGNRLLQHGHPAESNRFG